MRKIFLFITLAATMLPSSLLSQESTEQEEQTPVIQHKITVTATRIDTPTTEVASSVTVITREELESMNKSTVLEALQDVMGVVIIQNGPKGGSAAVFLRGANSEHAMFMMDGVELNDPITPSRSYDLAHLSLDNVERIEILRGPQSTLYGSDALAGVINIITKKGQGKPSVLLSSYGGSYGIYSGGAEISGSTDKAHYSFGTSYIQSSGFSAANTLYEGNTEKDGYRNLSLSGRFGFSLASNLDFDFFMRSLNTKTEIDNFGGAYGDDPNNLQEYDTLFLKGQLRGLFLQNRWEQELNISFVDYHRKHDNPIDDTHPFDTDNSQYKSRLWKLDWQHNFFLHETNTLTFGLDHHQERGESEYHSEGIWGPSSSFFPLKKSHISGVYVQDRIRIANKFYATVGTRLDEHKQFGTSITYRLAPAYFVEKTHTRLKATYGTGFKSPSLYQLYAPGTFWGPIGNEHLEPEESVGWDLGIEQQIMEGKFLLAAAYFSNEFKNLIIFDSLQGFINVGKAQSRGVELLFRARPIEKLLLNASYTRTEAKDKDTDTYLLRRPRDKFSASLNYGFFNKGNISISLTHMGERDDMYWLEWTATRVTMSSFTLLNSAASYDIFSNVQIFVRLENMLNAKYELIKGYATPELSVYGGLKINF